MANLIVSGAAGRMGRLLVSIIVNEGTHRLAGALEAPGNPVIRRRTLNAEVGHVRRD